MSVIASDYKWCGRLSAIGLTLCAVLGFVLPAVADSAADAVMFRKPKPVPPPQQSFLLDVAPVKEVKAPMPAPAPVVKPAPAPKPAPVVAPTPAPKPVEAPTVEVMSQSSGNTNSPSKIEGVAVGRESMTGDEIIPPRPSGALPLSQGESLGSHPQLCDITKVEKPEAPAPAVAPVIPVEKKAAEPVKVEEKKVDEKKEDTSKVEEKKTEETSKAEEKKVDEGAKADKKKDGKKDGKKKKKEKSDKPVRDALITADRTDYDRKEGVVLFDRNVHVDDAQYQMHADRLFLFLEGTNDLKRLVAIGHVAITNEDKRAYCARATFNKKLGRVVMYSSDEITAELREEGKKGSDVKGEKITFWLDSEQVEVENPVITMPGGIGGQGNMKKLIGK